MKKLLFLFLLGLSFTVQAQFQRTMYVAAKSGLNMRDKPDAGATLLEKIPYGTKIVVTEMDGDTKTMLLEGIEGRWQQVKYNNKTGYVLDVYLFPSAPPKSTVKDMKAYLGQLSAPFGTRLVLKSGNMNNIEESGWVLEKQLYKNGGEWHQFGGYEYGSTTYFLPGFTLQQAFILLRMLPEFDELLKEKDEFPTADKTIQRGDGDYIIKVEKETIGDASWVRRIRIEFSSGAYYSFEMHQIDNQVVIFYGSGV